MMNMAKKSKTEEEEETNLQIVHSLHVLLAARYPRKKKELYTV